MSRRKKTALGILLGVAMCGALAPGPTDKVECQDDDLTCRIEALTDAVREHDDEHTRGELEAFVDDHIAAIRTSVRPLDDYGQELVAIQNALSMVDKLLAALPGHSDLHDLRTALIARGDALVSGRFPLGSHVEVSKWVFGQSVERLSAGVLLAEHKRGVDKVFLIQDGDVVDGVYVVASTWSDGLRIDRLQDALLKISGHKLDTKVTSRKKRGIAHTKATLGDYDVLMGWHDRNLIEVAVGRVEP